MTGPFVEVVVTSTLSWRKQMYPPGTRFRFAPKVVAELLRTGHTKLADPADLPAVLAADEGPQANPAGRLTR